MAKSSDEPKITRIKASDAGSKNKKTPKTEKDLKSVKEQIADEEKKVSIFKRMGNYFRGSWQELKLVRWPDRAATWKMTGALIIFTVVFAAIILLLDFIFQTLFKLLIG